MMTKGNLRVRTITLPNNTAVENFPDDLDTASAAGARNEARGVTIHSRNAFNMKIAFNESGGIAAGNYITLDAGLYLTISPDEQVGKIYFQSANAAGDIVEILTSDTLIGLV